MKEGKVKSSNKGLVVLLCVLLAAIVGLGVGIMFINMNKEDFVALVDQKWNDNLNCFENGLVYDINVCIDDIYNVETGNNENVDRDSLVIELYNKTINRALNDDDYSKARELMIARSSFFVLNNNCDVAMSLLDDARIDDLDDINKGVFYSYAINVGVDCNDEVGLVKWNELLVNYNGGIDSGLGF